MSTAGSSSLGNLTMSRKEDFKAFAEAPRRQQPELLARASLMALDEQARADYNKRRRIWHANVGPINTPQLAELLVDKKVDMMYPKYVVRKKSAGM